VATKEQLEQGIRKAYESGEIDLAKRLAVEYKKIPTKSEYAGIAGHPATRVAYGAAAAPIGAAQLVAEGLSGAPQAALPTPLRALKLGLMGADAAAGEQNVVAEAIKEKLRQYETAKEQGRKERGSEGFDWWELAGMGTTPFALAKGAAIKAPASWYGRMGAAGAEGAGYGASMPVTGDDFGTEKVKQALTGAALGTAFGGAQELGRKGFQYGKELFSPKKTAEDFIKKKFGGDTAKYKEAVEGYQERLPGHQPTVAEALGQQQRKLQGEGTADLYSKEAVQLSKDLQKVGRSLDEADIGADIKMRELITGEKLTRAGERTVMKEIGKQADIDYSKATGQIEIPSELTKRPSVRKAITKVRQAIMEAPERYGKLPTEKNKLTVAQFGRLKREIGETVSRKVGKGKMNKTEASEIQGTLNKVNESLKEASPEYKLADEQFSKGMVPVTKGRLSRGLEEKLFPEGRARQGAAYMKSIEDEAILTKLTGKLTTSIDDVFEKSSANQKRAVKEMLLDQWQAKRVKGASQIAEIDGKITLELPHILSRPVVITNAVLKHFGKDLTPELHKHLELIMRDPSRFIKVLDGPVESTETKAAVDLVRRLGAMAAANEAGE